MEKQKRKINKSTCANKDFTFFEIMIFLKYYKRILI